MTNEMTNEMTNFSIQEHLTSQHHPSKTSFLFFLPRFFSLGCSVSSPSSLGCIIIIKALLGLVENVEPDEVIPGRQAVLPLLRGC
jgi:hypothetical protein